MSSLKNRNNKKSNHLIKIGSAIALTALVAGGLFIYKKNYQDKTLSNVTQSQISNNTQTNPSQNINNNAIQSEPIHPKVVIPNKPGNIKDLITILASKAGLSVDWKLKGYYNLNAEEIGQFNNPIGLIIIPITDMMTLYNKELKVKWNLGNPGEQFPYPTNVMTLICGKTLMFFELEDPNQIQTLLKRPDFKHCSIPDAMLGSAFLGPEINQYDFSKPPPFLKSYDATATQPQATDANRIIENKIDPKFTNEDGTPKLNWDTPTASGLIEFVPPTLSK